MSNRVIAGKLALVTGGARGIGRCIAESLLREGVRVCLADIDLATAERTAMELRGIGPEVHAFELDVRDAEAFFALVGRIETRHGPVDILVNNAGIMCLGSFLDQDPVLDERQLDINVRGVIHGMRAVLPRMTHRRRGHVVNIASAAGRVGIPHAAVYSATKHAVIGLTEAVRQEYRDDGVDFSFVMPSLVDTELIAGAGRLRFPPPARPEQVARAVVHALLTGGVDYYVPRFARLSTVLPALLPRRVYERIGRLFGVADIFRDHDQEARASYDERIRQAG